MFKSEQDTFWGEVAVLAVMASWHEDRAVLCFAEGAGAGTGLACPSLSLSVLLPTRPLFVLHMPGPRSAQTVEISFAENYTSDQNVS